MRNGAVSGKAAQFIAKAGAAPVFAGVSAADLARLFGSTTHLSLRKDQTVFARGDAAASVYVVLSGVVRISTLSAAGKRITVEIFQRDELLGEIAGIDDGVRTADAIAMDASELVSIPAATFRGVLAVSAALANNLLRLTTARLRRTYALLEDASLRSVELRLAKQVLYLVKLGAVGDRQMRLQVRMHQDELADLLGITTRSIINVLNKWRADALVTFDGRTAQLTILDLDRLSALTRE